MMIKTKMKTRLTQEMIITQIYKPFFNELFGLFWD
ncbi:hypothetical protein CUP0961 [Campylobacter upsaliensis RM3195]|nr:hypothetical protein CUP0961 [Campylobacter upsaliensis RM3195]